MKPLDVESLEQTARRATPGPWIKEYIDWEHCWHFGTGYTAVGTVNGVPDSGYIAAFNPETALALIAEIRRLRSAVDTARGVFGIFAHGDNWPDAYVRADSLTVLAQLDAILRGSENESS